MKKAAMTLIVSETKMEGDKERGEMKKEQGLKEANEGYNDSGIKAGSRSGYGLFIFVINE